MPTRISRIGTSKPVEERVTSAICNQRAVNSGELKQWIGCCIAWRVLAAAVVFVGLNGPVASAQSIDSYENILRVLDPSIQARFWKGGKLPAKPTDLAKCNTPETLQFWSIIKALAEEEAYQSRLRGKASFAFTGDTVPQESSEVTQLSDSSGEESPSDPLLIPPQNSSQYKFAAGLELARGGYPGEFKFASSVTFRAQDKPLTLREDVTQFRVSYDYYVTPWLEPYVFASRLSDSFLSIDQRYEIGAGVFFGLHFGRWIKDPPQPNALHKVLSTIEAQQKAKLRGARNTLDEMKKSLASTDTHEKNDPIRVQIFGEIINKLKSFREEVDALLLVPDDLKVILDNVDNLYADLQVVPVLAPTEARFNTAFATISTSFAKLERSLEHHNQLRSIVKQTLLQFETGERTPWFVCYNAISKHSGTDEMKPEAARIIMRRVRAWWELMQHAQNQRHKLFRLGSLVGAFSEVEQATLKNTLAQTIVIPPEQDRPDPIIVESEGTRRLPATQRPRWEFRPTVEFRPDKRWFFKADWYQKFGFGGFSPSALCWVHFDCDEGEDVRSTMEASVTFNVSDTEIGQPGNVQVTARFQRYFDGLPPSADFVVSQLDPDMPGGVSDDIQPIGSGTLTALTSHVIFQLEMSITWK